MDFRQYDNALGRFTSIDPLAEFQRKWNPYHFAFDNPVLFNDPTGLIGDVIVPEKKVEVIPTPLREVVVYGRHKKSLATTAISIVSFLVEAAPFAGSIKQIGVGIYKGDWKEITLGTVFLAIDIFTAGEGGSALRLAKIAGEDGLKVLAKDEAKELVEHNLDEIGEGVYEFKYIEDGIEKEYTGQSKNITKRLEQHAAGSKKVKPKIPIKGTVKRTAVQGGKTQAEKKTYREILETKILRDKKGPGGANGNKVWPVSAKREAVLKAAGIWN